GAGVDRFSGPGVHDFKDELEFVEMYRAALREAVEAPRTYLGSSGVVKASGAPRALDAPLDARNARARLTGMNRSANGRRPQIEPKIAGHLRQMKRVGRSADQNRAVSVEHQPQPLLGVQPASRKSQRSDVTRAIDRDPVADIRSKRKGTKYNVVGAYAAGRVDVAPTAHPGLPVFGGVQPLEGCGCRTGSLMEITIVRQRIGKQSPVRGVTLLFRYKIALGCERHSFQVVG